MGRTKPMVTADYIVGITDGEGCFYVNLGKSNAYKSGWRVQMHFHLKLQETDRELLEKICATLNCGNVYFQKEQRKNHAQCYRYSVSAWRDIESILIPFFKKHPLQTASKSKSFAIFCKIADLVSQGEHRTQNGIEKIRTLKQCMNKRTTGLA
ncbi:LAGLIDADG family homing endonuclease [Candidatus Pacebacteria bacterium]|nr:LAGLIDADG family homing endonuclease [Candidatus Paceibacterota bacterium]